MRHVVFLNHPFVAQKHKWQLEPDNFNALLTSFFDRAKIRIRPNSLRSQGFLYSHLRAGGCCGCWSGGGCTGCNLFRHLYLLCLLFGKDWFRDWRRCWGAWRSRHDRLGLRRGRRFLRRLRHELLGNGENVLVQVVDSPLNFLCRLFKGFENLQSSQNDLHDLRWATLFPWRIRAIKLSPHSPSVLTLFSGSRNLRHLCVATESTGEEVKRELEIGLDSGENSSSNSIRGEKKTFATNDDEPKRNPY